MNAIEERERADFENTLGRHTASLCEFARPYVGRLTKADSGSFLAAALAEAWLRRTDFDPEQDQIEVLYDPAAHPDAELTIEHDPETGAAHLLLDGRPLAVVQNGAMLTTEAIRLTAERDQDQDLRGFKD